MTTAQPRPDRRAGDGRDPYDDAVVALDARSEKWDLYRAYDGRWIIRFGSDDPRSVSGATLRECLAAAVACVPLPAYPRRPVTTTQDLVVTKAGRAWAITDARSDYGRSEITTKAEAVAALARWREREAEIQAEWDAAYAHLVGQGVEWQDFRWTRTSFQPASSQPSQVQP